LRSKKTWQEWEIPRDSDAKWPAAPKKLALIACAFNYEARATEFSKLGRIPVLKARMNADLHMSDDPKNTGKGNRFVIFGEPDIDIHSAERGKLLPKIDGKFRVQVNGKVADEDKWRGCISPKYGSSFAATARMALPAGSSTPSTTRKAFSFVTPTSWAQTIRIARSKQPSKPKSTRKHGLHSIVTPRGRSQSQNPAAWP
jgi:adenine-specific DNA-methyltransferase